MKQDYYSILGVAKNASQEDVKKAYRKLAIQYHPDKKGGDEKKFKEINEAYSILGDEKKRNYYDRFGSAPGSQGAGGDPFGGFGGFRHGNGSQDFGDIFGGSFDLNDLFEQFFGGAPRGGFRGSARTHARNWTTLELEIPLSLAVLGGTVEVQTQWGKARIEIPPGTETGESIRWSDTSIDIIFVMKVKTPRHISKKARELFEALKKEGL